MRTNVEPSVHASRSLADTDPAVREALDNEARRQRNQIELIASENLMSRAVREALGQPLEANLDGISDPDGRPTDITYRWLTVSTLPGTIDDATGPTYHPTADLVGERLQVEVRFTDGRGHAEGPLTSEATAPVLATANHGDLRLADGPTAGSGRLEAFHRNQWGTVCDDRFKGTVEDNRLKDHYAPGVACKQLGYATARMVSRARLGMTMAPLSQPTWLDDIIASYHDQPGIAQPAYCQIWFRRPDRDSTRLCLREMGPAGLRYLNYCPERP